MTQRDNGGEYEFLDWLGIRNAPNWGAASVLGKLVGTILVVFVPLLFLGAILVSGLVLFSTAKTALIGGAAGGINLGAGALIAALLGAPFVIWGTWLKYQTVRYQKEGHITDRINKAVEMLGAEKTVKKLKKDKSGSVEVTAPNIEVRIGAILSLERIAQDSTAHDKGRDHVRVMEILCAYVRENSNARKPVDYPEPEWVPLEVGADEATRDAYLARRRKRFGSVWRQSTALRWAKDLPKPRADIAQAMTVIGRRYDGQRAAEASWPEQPNAQMTWIFDGRDMKGERNQDLESGIKETPRKIEESLEAIRDQERKFASYTGYRIDLRGANLQGADLTGADLSGAHLNGARLEGADLRLAALRGADLSRGHLEGTNLTKVKMDGAKLQEARLEAANLSFAQINGASFRFARMQAANLSGVHSRGAEFTEARLETSRLSKASLVGSNLYQARLEDADLFRSKLCGADLDGARLEDAQLLDADLTKANLTFASLQRVNLRGAKLEGLTLSGAKFSGACLRFDGETAVALNSEQAASLFADGSVVLADGSTRPEHWPEGKLDVRTFDKEWRKWQADRQGYRPPSGQAEGGVAD